MNNSKGCIVEIAVEEDCDRVWTLCLVLIFFFFQAEDGIRDVAVTGVQTCALPIYGEKLALVLDDHAGAELCRFDAAHCFCGPDRVGADSSLESLLISEIPAGGLKLDRKSVV